MHFNGTIWRPPFEAWSALVQVTSGCTHHRCKFCTLYEDLPYKFKMSPIDEIEEDIREIYLSMPKAARLFLVGANPFVLDADKLKTIANLAKQYLQNLNSIGCFARITDIAAKTADELKSLRVLGYNRITIGVETGDDEALLFMQKGYTSKDIMEQCLRLEEADIEYDFFYLTGIYGKGKSCSGVQNTLKVFNRLSPKIIGASMLTVYPSSELYGEMLKGSWEEEGEREKLEELKALIQGLEIKTHFAALGASNMFQFHGDLPLDKSRLREDIEAILKKYDEEVLRNYRVNLKHL